MFLAIIKLLASLGVFLIGFKLLSENIEKLATKGLKKLFNKTSKNKFVGVGIGAVTTALVQSSAATTVMVVGFVNAGIMDLFQATTVIMGANIGTTITAQIAALGSFKFGAYAMVLTFIGVFMNMLSKKDKIKTLGLSLAGFGLLFFGLTSMEASMSAITSSNDTISNLLISIKNPILLVLIGLIITALVQSSAAVTSIVIALAAAGVVIGGAGNGVLFVILGTNIGTCLTALISSIGANQNAKRASLIHLMFNVFGSIIFIIMLLIWKNFMEITFAAWFDSAPTQIAMFHTFFNVLCTLLFIPFTGLFVKLSKLLIKDKETKKAKLTYVDERMLEYPSVALGLLGKEMSLMSFKAINALNTSVEAFLNKDDSKKEEIDKINDELEETNQAIMNYLVKVSVGLGYHDEQIASSYHHNSNDIMRLGELADNICKYTKNIVRENMSFSDKVTVEIHEMMANINKMFELTNDTFLSRKMDLLPEIEKIEETIDNMRTTLIASHLDRLKAGLCKPESSSVFINLVNNLERAADHLNFIAQSVREN